MEAPPGPPERGRLADRHVGAVGLLRPRGVGLREVLERAGARIVEIGDAHPAVIAVDALLVDVGERCDLGLVANWRARHADLPILALGPFGEPELRLAGHDAGADACLARDASPAVVRSWLDAVTGRNRLARHAAAAPA
jgi:DNA-binding response OmpR family regulator